MTTEDRLDKYLSEKDEDFDIFEISAAQKTIGTHVCAKCWGTITFVVVSKNHAKVFCPACGDKQGLVTRHWAEQQKAKDRLEALEVKSTLRDAGIIKEPNKMTEEELIKALGFD